MGHRETVTVKVDDNVTIQKEPVASKDAADVEVEKCETLLLEGTQMPDHSVDLMDVVEAINRMCGNMSTSYQGEVDKEPVEETVVETVSEQCEWEESLDWTRLEIDAVVESEESVEFLKCKPRDSFVEEVLNCVQNIPERVQCSSIQEVDEISPRKETGEFVNQEVTTPNEEIEIRSQVAEHQNESTESLPFQSVEIEPIRRIEGFERWSDSASFISLPGQAEDTASVPTVEPASEMYYTASSEVSLLSDLESTEMADKERKVVVAGHVAAMRERFESMTRASTPRPDAPSPDLLG